MSFCGPALQAQPASITGLTTITPCDIYQCASVLPENPAIGIWPAPFLLPTLSRASVVVPLSFTTVGLAGGAGGGWTDLTGLISSLWKVTPVFTFGVNALAGWKQASGFVGHAEASVDVHARMQVDGAWYAGLGVDALLYYASWRAPPPRQVRLGLGYRDRTSLALDVEAGPSAPICVMVSAAYTVSPELMGRMTLRTQPLAIGLAARIGMHGWPAVTLGIEQLLAIGVQTMVVVEL